MAKSIPHQNVLSKISYARLILLCGLFYVFSNHTYAVEKHDERRHAASNGFSGILFLYEKSNLDGSNPGLIANYYLTDNVIESFKWRDGANHATKVRATMNPKTLDVNLFEAIRVDKDGKENKYAELKAVANGNFAMTFGENTSSIQLQNHHWHSYDFDFAGLGYAFKHYKHRDSIKFHIFDIDMFSEKKEFTDFGAVTLQRLSEDTYEGRQALKYKIDGIGLNNNGGHIWFDRDKLHLVGFEINKPDEPGYSSGKLTLKKVSKITLAQWHEFQRIALTH